MNQAEKVVSICKGSRDSGNLVLEFKETLKKPCSMKLGLYQAHKIVAKDKFTTAGRKSSQKGIGECCVWLKDVKFTWHDRGDLHPKVSTVIDWCGLEIDDETFKAIGDAIGNAQEYWSGRREVAEYDIRISWKADDSYWRYSPKTGKAEKVRGEWP